MPPLFVPVGVHPAKGWFYTLQLFILEGGLLPRWVYPVEVLHPFLGPRVSIAF